MKHWFLFLLAVMLGAYASTWWRYDNTHSQKGSLVGELPPLEERVPPHLKEKARERSQKKK